MNRVLLVSAIAVLLSACGSTKVTKAEDPGSMTPIHSQKLTSNFKRKGVKLEFDCSFGTGMFGTTDAVCSKTDIKGIEVTAYAPSFGNSENNREQAFRVAEMRAKAKLRHFINEDVASSQVKTVIAKNIEKANDRIKQRISTNEEVSMTIFIDKSSFELFADNGLSLLTSVIFPNEDFTKIKLTSSKNILINKMIFTPLHSIW